MPVKVREVGPRDGFQNEPEMIPTADKVRLIEALAGAGLTRIEVTSFVRADVIPQLADGPEVLARIDVPDVVQLSVLVPNPRGLELIDTQVARLQRLFGEIAADSPARARIGLDLRYWRARRASAQVVTRPAGTPDEVLSEPR